MSGAAKVTPTEVDLSLAPAAKQGVYAYLGLPAPRGSLSAELLTNPQQLYDRYTVDGTIKIGYDHAFFQALQYLSFSNKLWTRRIENGALHGGAVVRQKDAPTANGPTEFNFRDAASDYDLQNKDGRPELPVTPASFDSAADQLTVVSPVYAALATGDIATLSTTGTLPLPLVTSTNYYVVKSTTPNKIGLAASAEDAANGILVDITTFGIGNHSVNVAAKATNGTFTIDLSNDTLTVSQTFYNGSLTGDTVTLETTGALPVELTSGTTYYVIKTATPGKIKLGTTLPNATNGVAIDLTSGGTGTATITNTTIIPTAAGDSKLLLIYGVDPGSWNGELSYKLTPYTGYETLVKEPGAFLIEVYLGTKKVDEYLCSRDPNKKDGRGQNIYVEEAVKSGNYIRVIDNVALPSTIQPKAQLTLAALSAGSDGGTVTEYDLIEALTALENKQAYPLALVTDSGWATPAYHNAIIQLCEKRGDCAFIFGAPLAAEASADYLSEIVDYKTVELNSVSSYGGIYSSYIKIADAQNSRQIFISPSGHVAGKFAWVWEQFDPWYPVAGKNRGRLEILGLYRQFDDGQMDYLYDNNINPLKFEQGEGITIHGQKTLQTRPSDLDRMHARMLLIVIKPALTKLLENFLFEFNEPNTRAFLRSIMENYMEGIKVRKGVYEYKVVCDETNNSDMDIQQKRLRVNLLIKIMGVIEYIPFQIGIVGKSIDLKLAESLL